MPNYQAPLDAPESPQVYKKSSNIPFALWLQLLLLPALLLITYFFQLTNGRISLACLSVFLWIEIVFYPVNNSDTPFAKLRILAAGAATATLLGALVPFFYYSFWAAVVYNIGAACLALYFFLWGTIPKDNPQHRTLSHLILGAFLAFLAFCITCFGFVDDLFLFYLFFSIIPITILTIVLLLFYLFTPAKEKKDAVEQLDLIRIPMLLFIIAHTSMTYYYSF
ncbi:MAG: hypothetical protein AB8E82_18025 [Aureispira sp.]